jgi:hypothetical protein
MRQCYPLPIILALSMARFHKLPISPMRPIFPRPSRQLRKLTSTRHNTFLPDARTQFHALGNVSMAAYSASKDENVPQHVQKAAVTACPFAGPFPLPSPTQAVPLHDYDRALHFTGSSPRQRGNCSTSRRSPAPGVLPLPSTHSRLSHCASSGTQAWFT